MKVAAYRSVKRMRVRTKSVNNLFVEYEHFLNKDRMSEVGKKSSTGHEIVTLGIGNYYNKANINKSERVLS